MFLCAVIAKVMVEENLSQFQIGFLKDKFQGQRIDVPAIDFKVLRHRTSTFDSQWIKEVLISVILCREFASHKNCLNVARYMFRKR